MVVDATVVVPTTEDAPVSSLDLLVLDLIDWFSAAPFVEANALEAVPEIEVTVGPDAETVLVRQTVTGYATSTVDPCMASVFVTVDTTGASHSPVEMDVGAAMVTVLVTSAVAEPSAVSLALLSALGGIGAPARMHTAWSGSRSTRPSMSQLPWMQVMRSGRKLPAEARHRHAMSLILQLLYCD
jgi:hypothetical protein